MIRITIEMVPMGLDHLKRHMATIEIHNDIAESLASEGRRGSYVARFSRISQRGQHLGWYDRQVHFDNINRNQSGAVFRIVHQALTKFLGDD